MVGQPSGARTADRISTHIFILILHEESIMYGSAGLIEVFSLIKLGTSVIQILIQRLLT